MLPDIKICPKCGNKNLSSEQFCTKCNTSLIGVKIVYADRPTTSSYNLGSATSSYNLGSATSTRQDGDIMAELAHIRRGVDFLVVVTVIGLVLLAGTLLYYLTL